MLFSKAPSSIISESFFLPSIIEITRADRSRHHKQTFKGMNVMANCFVEIFDQSCVDARFFASVEGGGIRHDRIYILKTPVADLICDGIENYFCSD